MRELDQATITPDVASRAEAPQVYQRHAAALYGQALLILGEKDQAEQVACDVMVDESVRLPGSREDAEAASRRLAVSVLRRCRELTVGPVPRPSPPSDDSDGHAASLACLRRLEREALSLVLFGHFGYRQVARELAVPPREAAALLRAALIGLGS